MGSVIVRSAAGLRQEVTAGRFTLVSDEPQAAVFYDGDVCLGGGWIETSSLT